MPSLEIHPLSALRDEPAELLAKRYARQRAAESYPGMELPSIEEHEEGWNDLWPLRGFRPQYLRLYRAVP